MWWRLICATGNGDTAAPAYNICSGTATSLLSVIDTLNELAGYDIQVSINPDLIRAMKSRRFMAHPLCWKPPIGSYRKYALRDTLAWMLAEK
jgi:nucleoside-diphosphate-sugar epimerase